MAHAPRLRNDLRLQAQMRPARVTTRRLVSCKGEQRSQTEKDTISYHVMGEIGATHDDLIYSYFSRQTKMDAKVLSISILQ